MIKINISGDTCITQSYVLSDCFSNEVISFFEESDLNILNLECPVIDGKEFKKNIKTGPHLHTSKDIFNQLRIIHTHAVTLANNHILDYGSSGLENTMQLCSDNNIIPIGVGINIEDAVRPVIIEKQGIRIGIINFCENEWSIATKTSPGANPLDIIANLIQLKQVRKQADFVFVIVHGGHEYYNLPSPRMVAQYRFFAENGADVVIGHHTHCLSGYEIHNKVPIFYGLGNFIFTHNSLHDDWYTGLVLQLIIENNKELKFKLQPIRQDKTTFKLSLLNENDSHEILKLVEEYSKIIVNEQLLLSKWEQLINIRSEEYLEIFSPVNIFRNKKIRNLLKKLGISKIFRGKQHYKLVLNSIRCESHLDISINAIKKIIK